MDRERAERVLAMFAKRGEVDALASAGPAVAGAHRITIDIAQAAISAEGEAFASTTAERFRTGRHEAEYFDPDRPSEKAEIDARWAVEKAAAAIDAVSSALG
jgi:hypothetical protein